MTQRSHKAPELTPLEGLDLGSVDGFAPMLRQMARTAFGARNLGEAHEVFQAMVADPDCTIIVTVSGAMTVAKMGPVLCRMIEGGMADLVVATGAAVTHSVSEAVGGHHYRHDPRVGDRQLRETGYHRVYDSLEVSANLDAVEQFVHGVLEDLDRKGPLSSHQLNHALGKRLSDTGKTPSVLGTAFQKGVPVYVPALTDSELGLDVASFFLARNRKPGAKQSLDELFGAVPPFNPYLDLYDFATRLLRAPRLGIFTVGGGVPRNWAQQVSPFIDSLNRNLGIPLSPPRIQFGVRICPDPPHWGSLGGATYSEGVSWGKFVPPEDGGRFAEVHCDATIAWPLLVMAVLESRARDRG